MPELKDSKEFQKVRERFLPHNLSVAVDGYAEYLSFVKSIQDGNQIIVVYEIKGVKEYKTGV